ncbi:MAG: Allantoinase, partial [Modestobacter sp.]|nr:Allantoinase [Modestobacter sp.]
MLDLAIIGGTVVTPDGPAHLDIGVVDGVIAHVSLPGALPEAHRTVDVTGKLVLPGGVDPHVHTNPPGGMENVLGRDVIGLAALYGGMTTMIDFVWPGNGSPQAAIDAAIDDWNGTAYTNYGFHIVLSDQSSDEHVDQIPALISQGFPSYKVFTTSITPTMFDGFRTSTGQLFEILSRTAANGGI